MPACPPPVMLFMVERKVSDMLNANLINKAAMYYRGIKLFNRLPFTIKIHDTQLFKPALHDLLVHSYSAE